MTDPLRPGGFRLWGSHGGPVDCYDDFDALRAMLNPSRVALVSIIERVGFRVFMTFLEYKYFTPGTPMNSHFRMAVVTWGEMKWVVIFIHKKHLEKADGLLKLFGLRRADGVPTVIRAETAVDIQMAVRNKETAMKTFGREFNGMVVERFPLDAPNVWTIENVAGHFTYGNDKALEQKARDFEDQACEQLFAEHRARRAAGEFEHERGTMPPKRI